MKRNEAVVTTAVAPSSAALTAADRCDRCGAQAYLRVELQTGGELLFCAHHAREHGDKLREVAVNVVDETHKLGDTPHARRPKPSSDPAPPARRRPRTTVRGRRHFRARPRVGGCAA